MSTQVEFGSSRTRAQQQILNDLLGRFATDVPHVTHVVAVSSDGLPLAASASVSDANRDQLCAGACTTMAIHSSAARLMGSGEVINILCDMDGGSAIYQKTSSGLVILMVLVDHHADLAQVQHDLEVLGERLGEVLNPGPRDGGGSAPAGQPNPYAVGR